MTTTTTGAAASGDLAQCQRQAHDAMTALRAAADQFRRKLPVDQTLIQQLALQTDVAITRLEAAAARRYQQPLTHSVPTYGRRYGATVTDPYEIYMLQERRIAMVKS